MGNTQRVDRSLFVQDHYLGKPAYQEDVLVQRRIAIIKQWNDEFAEKFFQSQGILLDIGCGNGNTILPLSPYFSSSIGLEYNELHKEEFNSLQKQLQISNSSFIVWDICNAPYLQLADRLISLEVIEHLPNEDDGVRNYVNSLVSGGIAILSVPNKWWIFETHGASLPILKWNRVPFFGWLPRRLHEKWAHARTYTKKRIRCLLERHGFEVIRMVYVTAPMDVVSWKLLQKFLRTFVFSKSTTCIPFKSVSIMIYCKKK